MYVELCTHRIVDLVIMKNMVRRYRRRRTTRRTSGLAASPVLAVLPSNYYSSNRTYPGKIAGVSGIRTSGMYRRRRRRRTTRRTTRRTARRTGGLASSKIFNNPLIQEALRRTTRLK